MHANYEEILKHTIEFTPIWRNYPTEIKFKLLFLSSSFFCLVYPLFKRMNFSSYYGGDKKSYLEYYAESGNISMLSLLHKYTNEPGIPSLLSRAILFCEPNSKFEFSLNILQLAFNHLDILSTPRSILHSFYYSQKYNLNVPQKIEIEFWDNNNNNNNKNLLATKKKEIIDINIGPFNNSSFTFTQVFHLSLGCKEEKEIIDKLKTLDNGFLIRHILARSVKDIIDNNFDKEQYKHNQIKKVREMMKENNLDKTNKEWEEIILKAAENGQIEIIISLSETGININCKDKNGFSPLHIFVFNGWGGNGVKKLVEHGADVNARTNNNLTAYDLALLLPKKGIATNEIIDILTKLIQNGN